MVGNDVMLDNNKPAMLAGGIVLFSGHYQSCSYKLFSFYRKSEQYKKKIHICTIIEVLSDSL